MENEFLPKRRLIVVLVIATVVVFVTLVWLIASLKPWDRLGLQGPTATAAMLVMSDCTHPVKYWTEHPELFPPQVIIGGTVYQERELEALLSDDSQDFAQQLKVQLAVVFLNSLAGADQGAIETTVFEAYGWLMEHPTGNPLAEGELAAGRQLFDKLETYNLGLGGVAACEAAILRTKTVTPTGTMTEITSLASTTPTVSGTPTPTGQATQPTSSLITATRIPNTLPPTKTSPPINNTNTPTRTPVNTTQAPTITPTLLPTFTSTPQPSPTNTELPQPTPSYTALPAPTLTYTPIPPK